MIIYSRREGVSWKQGFLQKANYLESKMQLGPQARGFGIGELQALA